MLQCNPSMYLLLSWLLHQRQQTAVPPGRGSTSSFDNDGCFLLFLMCRASNDRCECKEGQDQRLLTLLLRERARARWSSKDAACNSIVRALALAIQSNPESLVDRARMRNADENAVRVKMHCEACSSCTCRLDAGCLEGVRWSVVVQQLCCLSIGLVEQQPACKFPQATQSRGH